MCSFKGCNTFFQVIGALASVVGFILILYGGIVSFNIDYAKAESQNLTSYPGLVGHLSCGSQFDYLWNNKSSASYISVDAVRRQTMQQCVAGQSGSIFLICVTAVFVLISAVAALYAACKSNRLAIFGSGLLLPLTFALLCVSVTLAVLMNSSTSSQFMSCKDLSVTDQLIVRSRGFLCIDGVAGRDDLTAAFQFLGAVACHFAGLGLSLFAMSILIYTTHSAFHHVEDKKNEDQLPYSASSGAYSAPLIVNPAAPATNSAYRY